MTMFRFSEPRSIWYEYRNVRCKSFPSCAETDWRVWRKAATPEERSG